MTSKVVLVMTPWGGKAHTKRRHAIRARVTAIRSQVAATCAWEAADSRTLAARRAWITAGPPT
jgi:hypothetical protein